MDNLGKIKMLTAIRAQQSMTQEYMAKKLNCTPSYISKIESGKKSCSDDFIKRYKTALGAPDLPLTDEEAVVFKQQLYKWKDLITFDELDEAGKILPSLTNCVALTLYDGLKNLFYIFEASYYRATKNNEALDVAMSKIKGITHLFNDEQAYWYNRQIGIDELSKLHYATALQAFLQAEKAGDILNLNNASLYLNMGNCLTSMGYASKALEYLEKSYKKAIAINDYSHDVYRRYFTAQNYSHTGRHLEAIEMLEGCLRDEKKKASATVTIGLIYRRIALAYLYMGDKAVALQYIEKSAENIDDKRPAYSDHLYYKAIILFENEKKHEGEICLHRAIEIEAKSTPSYIQYNALKHSMTLNNVCSLNYVECDAVPKLLEFQMNLPLLACYKQLTAFYVKNNKNKAFHYLQLTNELNEKLRKGELSK